MATSKGAGKTPGKASQEAERIILAMFETQQYITREEVEKALSLSRSAAKNRLSALVKDGVIIAEGLSSKTRYKLNKERISPQNLS